MTSNDNQQYVTVERDTERLQTSVYWGFAILGIIIAFVSITAPLLPEIFRESRNNKKHEDMKDAELSEAVAKAVNKALGTIGK